MKKNPPADDFRMTFPDLITALNLSAGVLALYAAIVGDLWLAVALVAAAMLFDFFDGRVARFLRQEHALGRELDSLADMVSFGVAPGVIALMRYDLSYVILAAAVVYAVAGAYRLARFNVLGMSEEAVGHFVGVPIPAAALLVLACALGGWSAGLPAWGAAVAILVIAGLMVSTVRIRKL